MPIPSAGVVAWLCSLAVARVAAACTMCFGNAQSPLTQGAQKGVLAMMVITYAVVIGLVAMFVCQIAGARRRRSNAGDGADQPSGARGDHWPEGPG